MKQNINLQYKSGKRLVSLEKGKEKWRERISPQDWKEPVNVDSEQEWRPAADVRSSAAAERKAARDSLSTDVQFPVCPSDPGGSWWNISPDLITSLRVWMAESWSRHWQNMTSWSSSPISCWCVKKGKNRQARLPFCFIWSPTGIRVWIQWNAASSAAADSIAGQ